MSREPIITLVAKNIEAIMGRKQTNASEVARKAKINPTGVYDILSGKSRAPRLDTLHKIALQGLGVPLSALFVENGGDDLDRELIETIGMMPASDRQRFLVMATAILEQTAKP